MTRKRPSRLALTLAVALLVNGCVRFMPSGFWSTYKPESIVEQYSDQGPWGGRRWMHWQASQGGAFSPSAVTQYATSNGWTCEAPVAYSGEQMKLWTYSGQNVFALPFGPGDERPNNAEVKGMPRFIEKDSVVIRCETGWTRVAPGTSKATPAFGYIHLDAAGSQMAVYHVWGDT